MAELSDKLTELEVEREVITATLDELKRAFEEGEITEEDYNSSRAEYEEKLHNIDAQITDVKREMGIEPVVAPADLTAEEIPPVEEVAPAPTEVPVAEEPAVAPFEEAPEVVAPAEKAVVEEEIYIPDEIEVRRFVDPGIIAKVEAIKGEIPSLNANLSSLTMKKQVAESSLKVLEKNHDDGLVDDATYESLKDKYEKEVTKTSSKIEEIKAQVEKRKSITSKYDDLLGVQADYDKKLKTVETDIFNRERELIFVEASKLFLVSSIRDYLAEIIKSYNKIEEESRAAGTPYPDQNFVAERKKEIDQGRENLAAAKSRSDNFDTLLDTLEREKDTGKIDQGTYSLLKKEYSRERSKAISQIGGINGKQKMLEEELKAYDKLKDILADCKSYIDMTRDSLKKIWLEDQISPKKKEIDKKKVELQKIEKEMSYKLEKLEESLEKLLRGF